jgi:hypothetical protein
MFNHSLSSFASFDGEHIGHMFLFDIDDAVVFEFWNIKSSAGEIDKLSQQLVVGNRFSEFLSKQIKAQSSARIDVLPKRYPSNKRFLFLSVNSGSKLDVLELH